MRLPKDVAEYLTEASRPKKVRTASVQFTCAVFGDRWDRFVEDWTPRIYDFIGAALGPYGKQPHPEIGKIDEAFHVAGANASFDPSTGRICLSTHLRNKPGMILEKLLHEMTHASLDRFPEGDPFYEEGFVDYSVWIMAHAPVWVPYGEATLASASTNIDTRRERAALDQSDFDRKRWTGGLYASIVRGPWIISTLRQKKIEGNFTW
jgi:hypothetical protein